MGGKVMRKKTLGIVLRILSIVVIAIAVYNYFRLEEYILLLDNGQISPEEYNKFINGIKIYLYTLPIFFVIDGIFNWDTKKKRRDRKISLREYAMFEFNYPDERESVLTGKSAKVALATIIYYTAIILVLFMFLTDMFNTKPWFLIFTTASIPVVGLIAYLISYRHYYSN
jgi:hypothetical protein